MDEAGGGGNAVTEITGHPAWKGGDAYAHAGLDFDALRTLTCLRTDRTDDLAALRALGIVWKSTASLATRVFAAAGGPKVDLQIHDRSGGSTVIVAPTSAARGTVSTTDPGQLMVFGGCTNQSQTFIVTMLGPTCAFIFGHHASAYGIRCDVEGPAGFVVFGRESMASGNVGLHGTDHHGIISRQTGELLNAPKDILIKEHVWLGREVMVLKGTTIGEGSILGARALVTSDIPPHTMAVGVPARVIRSDIAWTRRSPRQLSGQVWKVVDFYKLEPR